MSLKQPNNHNLNCFHIPSNTNTKKIASILFASICILSISGCTSECKKEIPPETYHNDFKKVVSENFSLTSIKSFSKPEISSKKFEVFGKPDFLYLITPENKKDPKTPIYLFNKNEYARDFGSDFNFNLEEICKNAKKVENEISDYGKWVKSVKEQTSFLKGLSMKVKVDLPVVKPEVGTDTKTIHELIAFIRLSKNLPGRARIVVRGFADVCVDGSIDCKIGKLIKYNGGNSNYEYKNVKGHRLNQLGDNAELRGYKSKEEFLETSNKNGEYTNEHLPNLRANFFKEEILSQARCSMDKLYSGIEILEGRVSRSDKNPEIRKVEIYLAIYNDRKNLYAN
jgi:hypothetical protein